MHLKLLQLLHGLPLLGKSVSQALAFIWGTVLCFILNIVDMKAAMGAGIVFVLWRLGFLELSFDADFPNFSETCPADFAGF